MLYLFSSDAFFCLVCIFPEYSFPLFARKSRRNWLPFSILFFNASLANSYICYNLLAHSKLSYLNHFVSVVEPLFFLVLRNQTQKSFLQARCVTQQHHYSVLLNWMVIDICLSLEPGVGVHTIAQKKFEFDWIQSTLLANRRFTWKTKKSCFFEHHQGFAGIFRLRINKLIKTTIFLLEKNSVPKGLKWWDTFSTETWSNGDFMFFLWKILVFHLPMESFLLTFSDSAENSFGHT